MSLWSRKRRLTLDLASAGDPWHWQSAIEALRTLLAQRTERAPCDITVILSDHFVRYALLPAQQGMRRGQWLDLARERLEALHGRGVDDHMLRVHPVSRSGERLAAAIEKPLLEALGAAIAREGHRLVSVQPRLMAVYNASRASLAGEPCWLVIEEAARLTLALVMHGAWRTVRTRWVAEQWADTLPEILERESALLGIDPPCTRAHIHEPAAA